MAKINIRGDIVLNEHKRFYDWLGWDCVCPRDVQDIVRAGSWPQGRRSIRHCEGILV